METIEEQIGKMGRDELSKVAQVLVDRHLEKLAADEYRAIGADYAEVLHKSAQVKSVLKAIGALGKRVGTQAAATGRAMKTQYVGKGKGMKGVVPAAKAGVGVLKRSPELAATLVGAGGYALGRSRS